MKDLDKVKVADIEARGLLDVLHGEDDFHVLSVGYKDMHGDWSIKSTTKKEDVLKVFKNPDNVIVGHYFIPYDAVALEKMFDFKIEATIIDSLAISWYLHNTEKKHGLEAYGEKYGVPKVKIAPEEWQGPLEGETLEEFRAKMESRCSQDVKININLWTEQLAYLREIYNTDEEIWRLIKYLNFIMKCASMQEQQKIQVDIDLVNKNLKYFEELKAEKFIALQQAMPKVPVTATKSKPKVLYKKDGTMSAAHIKWLEFLIACKLPEEREDAVEYIKGYEEANPNSVKQKKEWLYSLGWKPQTFAYNRDKESGDVKKVEQILTADKDLCPSIIKLVKENPAIKHLEGMSVLTHRIGLLKGLLKNSDENGFIVQGLYQLANSLRWQHSVVVNFPRVTGKGDIADGKWIRECLIAGEGYKFVQSDLSGIESRTSDHYTFDLNPELIEETAKPFFDPHTKIAVVSNLMTTDEEVWFKWKKENGERLRDGKEELPPETFGEITEAFEVMRILDKDGSKDLMNKLKGARASGKMTNYSSLYKIGAAALGRNLGITKNAAQDLIDSYNKIHWAVREISKTFEASIKTINKQMWILCPISGFYHPIRSTKDSFSVCNQAGATYVFNLWLWHIAEQGVYPILQTHDDELLRCKEEDVDKYIEITNEAMRRVNKQLKLNVEVACEVQVGDNFAETH